MRIGDVFAVVAVVGLAAIVVTMDNTIDASKQRRADERARKEAFIVRHDCLVDHYVSGRYEPKAIYKCNDGRVYSWQDIPI